MSFSFPLRAPGTTLHPRRAGTGQRPSQPLDHADGVLQCAGPERQCARLRSDELLERGVRECAARHRGGDGQCDRRGLR